MTDAVPTLRQLRAEKGLSIRQAGAKIGLSRGVLNRAERGDGIHPAHAKKIAKFYGLKVADLFPDDERQAA